MLCPHKDKNKLCESFNLESVYLKLFFGPAKNGRHLAGWVDFAVEHPLRKFGHNEVEAEQASHKGENRKGRGLEPEELLPKGA